MTGPEHYEIAEEILGSITDDPATPLSATIARAQVHATLALAAATVSDFVEEPAEEDSEPTWNDVCGV